MVATCRDRFSLFVILLCRYADICSSDGSSLLQVYTYLCDCLFIFKKLEIDAGTHQQESSRLRTENQTHLRDINELRDLVQVLQNDKSQVRLRQCVTWQSFTLLLRLLQLAAAAAIDQLEIARLRTENELQRADNDDLRRDNADLRTSNQSLITEKDQVIIITALYVDLS
jgi:hypothetical protein